MSRQAERLFCSACEEAVEVERVGPLYRCLVCGTAVQQNQGEANEQRRTVNEGEAIEEFIARMAPSKAPSEKAIAGLRRVRPDPRSRTLEPQVQIRLNGIIEGNCLGLPASFGPLLPEGVHSFPLQRCIPRHANTQQIDSALRGSWALVDRGGDVSFAFKAHVCELAGALGMLLVQTYDVWPFTPSDSTDEASQWGGIHIPIVAVSNAIGQRLHRLLDEQRGEGNLVIELSLLAGESDRICPICHDDLIDPGGNELIQLPCLHYFHSACILPWFNSNNTCPVCRFALERANSGVETLSTSEQSFHHLGWFG